MPSTPEAVTAFLKAKKFFAHEKHQTLVVCNFWFRNVSKLFTLSWTAEEVDEKLKELCQIFTNLVLLMVQKKTDLLTM
jgi:hypothetical protein